MSKEIDYFVNINGIDVNASYSESTVTSIFMPLLKRLTDIQKEQNRRIIVFIAAPPGAGKSTLSSFLQMLSERNEELTDIQAIGMDGFHRRQEYLLTHSAIRNGEKIKMVKIKGAPITFDLDLLKSRIEAIKLSNNVGWPEYDRHLHNPTDNAVIVDKKIILIEGNYLLLDEDGWRDLSKLADYTVFITANENLLRDRLIDRKEKSGNTLEAATKFVDYSDMENVRLCLTKSKKPDLMLNLTETGDYQIDMNM